MEVVGRARGRGEIFRRGVGLGFDAAAVQYDQVTDIGADNDLGHILLLPVMLPHPRERLIPVYAASLLFPEEDGVSLANELEVWEGDLSRPAAYMAAPFGRNDADRYFAIYIPGEAMEPRFKAGERVILDRIKPASIQTDVLVQLRDDTGRSLWTIGKLSARDRNLISLTQYRDKVTASIHRSKIRHIFPIIGMIDDDR
ncbi:hypothetical protein [Sphingobium quisquiliarum]|nr:hypothetical protein [Sphingobium quisquiliarum]